MTNIIQDHILLNGDHMSQADVEPNLQDLSITDVLDERFDVFLTNVAQDGNATVRDIFYNGMYTLINILNAVAEDYEGGDPYEDTLAVIEEALTEKAAENEIDLSYSEDPDDQVDLDDLIEEEPASVITEDFDGWDDDEDEEEDDQFTDDDK